MNRGRHRPCAEASAHVCVISVKLTSFKQSFLGHFMLKLEFTVQGTNIMPELRSKDSRKDKLVEESLVERVRHYSPVSSGPVSSTLALLAEREAVPNFPVLDDPISPGPGEQRGVATDVDAALRVVNDNMLKHQKVMTDSIASMKKAFESRMEQQLKLFSDGLKQHITDSVTELRNYVDAEIGRISTQINEITEKVAILEDKQTPEYDPEVSIILSKVPVNEGEDIYEVTKSIIHEALDLPDVPVVRATRLPQRQQGDRPVPPLVKAQLQSVDDKKKVLRVKKRLATAEGYKNVWIRSSRPHAERLTDQNFRTLLGLIGPQGNTVTINSNGRIVKKHPNDRNQPNNRDTPPTPE